MAVKVTMPKLGLTMTEGVLIQWLVGDGTEVRKGQPIFQIETDKVVNDAQADADGILRIVVDAGATVPVMGLVGYILAPGEEMPGNRESGTQGIRESGSYILVPGEEVPEERAGEPLDRAKEGATEKAQGRIARALASPAARRRAKELEVDINGIEGTGEDGRITLADVEAFAAR